METMMASLVNGFPQIIIAACLGAGFLLFFRVVSDRREGRGVQ